MRRTCKRASITMQEIGSGMIREIVRISNVAACHPIYAAAAGQG